MAGKKTCATCARGNSHAPIGFRGPVGENEMDLTAIQKMVEEQEKCVQCSKLYDDVTEMFREVTKYDRGEIKRSKNVEVGVLNLIKQMSTDRRCSSCEVIHCMARALFEQVLN